MARLSIRAALPFLSLLCSVPAVASNQNRPDAPYYLGRSDDALRSYRAAVLHSTADANGWLNLGVLYRDAGRAGDAERAFSAASNLRPSDPDVWEALGDAALQARDLEKASRAFRTAVEVSPTAYYARLGLGRTLLAQGDPELAARHFQEAVHARRGSSLAEFYLGRALEAEGSLESAQAAYQDALHQDGQFAEVRLSLGRILQARRKVNDAWVQYAKAAALDPSAGHAEKIQKSLKPRLTQAPETLIPVVRVGSAHRVLAAPQRDTSPILRVALGTDAAGRPLPQKAIEIRSGGAFTIARKADGRILARGGPGELWVLRKIPHKALYEAVGPDGKRAAVFKTAVVLKPLDERDTMILAALPSGSGYAWSALKDREVRESVEARPHPSGGLFLVNVVHLEDYLYGVVGEEMLVSWPAEALKAQAILARTQALAARSGSAHRDQGYDLCDGQHCQVYGGVSAESERVRAAVDSTRGLVLKHDGRLAAALYSSDCGGHTQSSAEAGWGDDPTLQGVSDAEPGVEFPSTPWGFEQWIRHEPAAYCGEARYTWPAEYRWDRVISADDLSARVNKHAAVGRIRAVRVLERARSGHVRRLVFSGEQGDWTLADESQIRKTLGLGSLRSAFFIVESYRGKDGKISEFVLHGAGWGHAVGLCQSGAAARAGQGEDFRGILADYFPADAVKPFDEPAAETKRPPLPRATHKRAAAQEGKS